MAAEIDPLDARGCVGYFLAEEKTRMIDASTDPERTPREKLLALSGEERMIIGAQMFDRFREMIRTSLPPGLSEMEQRRELFKRIYGQDLPN
ncbi:MAG: hypothetical protein M3R29_00250 [Verrucomicrobiota bacterium]|nr:hypothetical protein [Verrucomicrobiota bacterium]